MSSPASVLLPDHHRPRQRAPARDRDLVPPGAPGPGVHPLHARRGARPGELGPQHPADPSVSVRIGDRTFAGAGRIVEDGEEELEARHALPAKYRESYSDDLTEWGETALPVAVDLEA